MATAQEAHPESPCKLAGIALHRFTVAGSPGIDVGLFSAFTYNGGVAKVQ